MNDTKFKPIGDIMLIKATGETQTKSGIQLPGVDPKGQPANKRMLMIKDMTVLDKGDKVKRIEIGDKVIPQGHVFNNQLPYENIGAKQADNIKYYWAKEEDILGIIK